MFNSLQDGLKGAFKSLRGKARLSESNMRDGLKLVETSLLEADVSIDVIRDFMAKLGEKAMGEKVLLALDPSEQLVKIVHEELIDLLGPDIEPMTFNDDLTIIMMCGLQGAGKTTTCGKLAKLIQRKAKITPLLCAADLQRPAAIDQLHVLGETLNVPVYSNREETDPVQVCKEAVAKARADGNKVLILDTAGRLAIDEELMKQLQVIDREVQPHHVLLVVDGMTGQDAVKSAGAFHQALELNGVVMTKLDGDTRGGALLSVKAVTGVPIRFIGTGEHLEDLEVFRPEGMAGRILGLADMVALAETAQSIVSEEEQQRLQEQLEKGRFTLDDFRNHMIKVAKPGLMMKMMSMMGGMIPSEMSAMIGNKETSKQVMRMVGMIDSMTPPERKDPTLINLSRKNRIAKGSGATPKQVTELIKQYDMMKPMLTGMAGAGGEKGKMEQMKALQEKMMDPSKMLNKTKQNTGRRMTPAQKKAEKKKRDKLLKEKRRNKKRK